MKYTRTILALLAVSGAYLFPYHSEAASATPPRGTSTLERSSSPSPYGVREDYHDLNYNEGQRLDSLKPDRRNPDENDKQIQDRHATDEKIREDENSHRRNADMIREEDHRRRREDALHLEQTRRDTFGRK